LLDALPSLSCDGAASLDTSRLALFGHSMGATVAPLTLGLTDRYRAAILSGAGGSWIENVIHKESPLEVRPIAEAMLRYPAAGATLTEADPILSLLQYVGESADPPVWAPAIAAHAPAILMFQGIVDSYILPPMANATTLSLGLDVAEPVLDADEPRLNAYAPIASVLDLGAGGVLTPLPSSDRGAVVQIAEDGVEDGHEVAFQTARARELVRCFLQSVAVGTPQVGCPTDP
jgi:pimeloyl-ACP methyl ester carboxylesterase